MKERENEMKKYILQYNHYYSRYVLWQLNKEGKYNELCSSWFGSYTFEKILEDESNETYITKITDSLLDIIEPGDIVKTKKSKPFLWDGKRKIREENITHIWKYFCGSYPITYKEFKQSSVYHLPQRYHKWELYKMNDMEEPKPKVWDWKNRDW